MLSEIIAPSPIKHLSNLTPLPTLAFFKTTQSDKIADSSIFTLLPIEQRLEFEVFETPSPYQDSATLIPEVNLLF